MVWSISSPVRNGDVGWMVMLRSGRRPSAVSSHRTACCSAGTIPASSLASSAGRRNGTSAPCRRASAAMASLSVDTITRVRRLASRVEATAWPTRDTRPRARKFFPGSPLEPPRAGMTANAYGVPATASDLHPAPLRGGAARGVDHVHGAQPVPAVAARHRFPADTGEKMPGLLDVHIVELAGKRIDFPAVRLRVEQADLVLEAPPLDHARLAHQLKVAVHVPREEVHVDVADGAGREAHGQIRDVVGGHLQRRDVIDDGTHLGHLAAEPAHVIDGVAFVQDAAAALLDV